LYLSNADIQAAAAACESAGDSLGFSLRDRQVVEEDDATSVLLERLRNNLSGLSTSGARWDARKVTSRAKGSEESRTGADLLGVFEVNLPEISIRKGFLAQAKLHRGHRVNRGETHRLRQQCEQMLSITPDSFVFLYDKQGVHVLPAVLYSSGHLGLRHVAPWPLSRFFAAHFACFIGDPRLSGTTPEAFREIIDLSPPPNTLVVSAEVTD